jgi:siderophore synthetase component
VGVATEDEEAALWILRRDRPSLAETFLAQLPRARAEVLGRVWGALWREPVPGVSRRAHGPGRQDATLWLADGRTLSGPVQAAELFGERPARLTIRESPSGRSHQHPSTLVGSLPLPEPARVRVAGELANCCVNLALALTAEHDRSARLRASPEVASGRPPLIHRWVEERAQAEPAFRPLAFFEGLVVEGHPAHPCCRTRSGLAVTDVLAHAPEWDATVPVAVVAVSAQHHEGAGLAGVTLTALLRREHPAVAAAAEELPGWDGCELLPVHPWQLANVLSGRYGPAIEDGRLRVLPHVTIPAHPLLSYRTLAPAADPRASHLKTALDVPMTSVLRNVSHAAVQDAPRLSALLAEVLRRERWFSGRFRVLAEPATGCFFDDGPHDSLAALARESPARYLERGEVALPAAALAARSPLSGRAVLAELVEGFALRRGLPFEAAETAWMAAYCDVLVPPSLTLLSRWGVALEAHGQNTLVVLRGDVPVRVLYRDLLGVRISRPRLHRLGFEAPPLTATPIAPDDGELRAVLLASLFATQLGELIWTLARDCGTEPSRLWRTVADRCRSAYAPLLDDPSIGRQAASDAAVLFSEELPVKAMLTMRLASDPARYLWTSVPSPLAG